MIPRFYHSLPVQLFLQHLKGNPLIFLVWILMFMIITGNFGSTFGIPNLFLDPEYLGYVGFSSFFIVGISIAGFTMVYNMTSYIIDGHLFGFLATTYRPFTTYCLNNSLLPLIFLITYIINIIEFQSLNEFNTTAAIFLQILGLFCGILIMLLINFLYFRLTNKNVFEIIASSLDKKLKSVPITRENVMDRYRTELYTNISVQSYLNIKFKIKNIRRDSLFFRKEAILKVFNQNHLNSVIIMTSLFAIVLILGIFREVTFFQIPAAASAVLLLTIFLMVLGAFYYWVRKWTFPLLIVLFVLINFLVKLDILSGEYQVYGLDYSGETADYSLKNIEKLSMDHYAADRDSTLAILEKWRAKFPYKKPKMVLIGVSGGGQRAALWTMTALQKADSITGGNLMDHTVLITGASGGLIGASYFRELHYQKTLGEKLDLYADRFRRDMGSDNLNPIIFSLLVNDLFVRYQSFDYGNHRYTKDRGYAFEQQLSKNTGGILDKPLIAYRHPEKEALIPMLFISPTIINDSRKLYISPQRISYMNMAHPDIQEALPLKYKSVEYARLFEKQGADDLRFLSALRMGATFPYISPNVTLPSEPRIQIMDAGISDMFGMSDAVRFAYVFQDWIRENTSGIVLLSIRDSQKIQAREDRVGESLIEKLTDPVIRLYTNIGYEHDIRNDSQIEYAEQFMGNQIELINLEYRPVEQRAALSWRLTTREKLDITRNINLPHNQKALKKIRRLLN